MKKLIIRNATLSIILANILFANTQEQNAQDFAAQPTMQNSIVNYGNSFGAYAKLGLGYSARVITGSIGYYSYTSIDYRYVFTPGVSLYYSWRDKNGMGVEAALEYEFDMNLTSETREVMSNFFTPAVYFSWMYSDEMIGRIGIGYDIGLPYTYSGSNLYGNYTVTHMYHGIAIMTSDEWILDNNNAIGLFAKLAFRWQNINDTDTNISTNISGTDFSHVFFSFGLSYRFNMGF